MKQNTLWIKFFLCFLFFYFLPVISFYLFTMIILLIIDLSQNESLYGYAMVVPIISSLINIVLINPIRYFIEKYFYLKFDKIYNFTSYFHKHIIFIHLLLLIFISIDIGMAYILFNGDIIVGLFFSIILFSSFLTYLPIYRIITENK